MVENIYRQLALRHGTSVLDRRGHRRGGRRGGPADLLRRLRHRRGFLPIYVLSGPSGELFRPMADTMIFALLGVPDPDADPAARALLLGAAQGRPRAAQRRLRGGQERVREGPRLLHPPPRGRPSVASVLVLGASLLAHSRHRRRVHAPPRRGGALDPRDDALHDLLRGIVEDLPADPRDPALLPGGDRRRLRARTPRRRHGPDRLLQLRVLRRVEALLGVEGPVPDEAGAHRGDRQEAPGVSRASSSTTPSPPRTRWTKRRRV